MRRSLASLLAILPGLFLAAAEPQRPDNTDRPIGERSITKYQSAEEEAKRFIVPGGFSVELVAAEPLIINPVCIALDEKGRIYVSESHTYRFGPKGSPVKQATNPVVRLDPRPDGKGYERVLVAEGFDDPVMGMLVKDGKLWATANNYLYRFDLDESGKASNRKTLVTDRNKAWNPFGMFVLEWGPEGLLYLSVGNHNIQLDGPQGRVTSRGGSGIVVRMRPDGSGMEKLVEGLRVPYSFEYDPWGQLWLLSNGEGNPNRFVRVIEGVDYHCYSRGGVGNDWLAGRHPLAPPCFELPGGACTQLLRYYGANFPEEYVGSLFLDNWGRHGFGGANRTLFRYVPDERGNIVRKEGFLECKDPHFRCSHVLVDHDGSLLVADWYGRDDESDLTGRIWRVRYNGRGRPMVLHALESPRWKEQDYALSALGSPDHRIRDKAMAELHRQGNRVVAALGNHAGSARDPVAAANALWTLARIGTPEALNAVGSGASHGDWRVRRLAVRLLRQRSPELAAKTADKLQRDQDPAVRVEAALAQKSHVKLIEALEGGAAKDAHLRYEAAWHLARLADGGTLRRLLESDSEDVRLAGLIALDVTLYEKLPAAVESGKTLAAALEKPGKLELDLLLTLAGLHPSPALAPALNRLAGSDEVPPALAARAVLLARRVDPKSAGLSKEAGRRFLEAVRGGSVKLSSPAEVLTFFEVLAAEGPSDYALQQLEPRLTDRNPQVRAAAHDLARTFGVKADNLGKPLWSALNDPARKPADKLTFLGTLNAVEKGPATEKWDKLLSDGDSLLVRDAVRSWRLFAGNKEMVDLLVSRTPALVKKYPDLRDDLARVLTDLKANQAEGVELPAKTADAETRRTLALAARADANSPQLGRRVFERAGCVKCHTTVTENTPLAPTLKGIGKAQKPEYLVESVLEPSKVIKTGYETEQVLLDDGRVFVGLVKEEGKQLVILTADREHRVEKARVESRMVQKVSLMPTGQADNLSQAEFNDLMSYLQSLK